METLYVLRDLEDSIIAICDKKKILKKFRKQTGDKDFSIEEIDDPVLANKIKLTYSDVYVDYIDSKYDLVATEKQSNCIYSFESEIKYGATEATNLLELFAKLNITDDEKRVLLAARRIIKECASDENIYPTMVDAIELYLSNNGASLVDRINENNGEIWHR